MAYEVEFDIPWRPLSRSDIEFRVKQGDGTIGTLRVSKGSLVWFPRDTSIGYRIGWARFGDLLESEGRRVERRKRRSTDKR